MTEQPDHLDLQPLNDLEEKLARGEQPDANPVDVILAFLNNEVYIVSSDALEGADSQAAAAGALAKTAGEACSCPCSSRTEARATEQTREAATAPGPSHPGCRRPSATWADDLGTVISTPQALPSRSTKWHRKVWPYSAADTSSNPLRGPMGSDEPVRAGRRALTSPLGRGRLSVSRPAFLGKWDHASRRP